MKKHLANIITSLRIIGSMTLLFFFFPSLPFYIIYLICGLTDMIDGTIARKLNAVSSIGSKLDTVSDFVFMAVCVVKLLPIINLSIFLWIWIAIIAIIKVCNIVLGLVLRKKFVDFKAISVKKSEFSTKTTRCENGANSHEKQAQKPKNDNFLALFRSYKNRQKYNGSKKFHKKSGFAPDFFVLWV